MALNNLCHQSGQLEPGGALGVALLKLADPLFSRTTNSALLTERHQLWHLLSLEGLHLLLEEAGPGDLEEVANLFDYVSPLLVTRILGTWSCKKLPDLAHYHIGQVLVTDIGCEKEQDVR